MSDEDSKKTEGQKILNSFKRQLTLQKQKLKVSRGENPLDNSLDDIPNDESGVNTRNGFPKMQRIMRKDPTKLYKPKSNQIQAFSK